MINIFKNIGDPVHVDFSKGLNAYDQRRSKFYDKINKIEKNNKSRQNPALNHPERRERKYLQTFAATGDRYGDVKRPRPGNQTPGDVTPETESAPESHDDFSMTGSPDTMSQSSQITGKSPGFKRGGPYSQSGNQDDDL
jgi:hypothetical protein